MTKGAVLTPLLLVTTDAPPRVMLPNLVLTLVPSCSRIDSHPLACHNGQYIVLIGRRESAFGSAYSGLDARVPRSVISKNQTFWSSRSFSKLYQIQSTRRDDARIRISPYYQKLFANLRKIDRSPYVHPARRPCPVLQCIYSLGIGVMLLPIYSKSPFSPFFAVCCWRSLMCES